MQEATCTSSWGNDIDDGDTKGLTILGYALLYTEDTSLSSFIFSLGVTNIFITMEDNENLVHSIVTKDISGSYNIETYRWLFSNYPELRLNECNFLNYIEWSVSSSNYAALAAIIEGESSRVTNFIKTIMPVNIKRARLANVIRSLEQNIENWPNYYHKTKSAEYKYYSLSNLKDGIAIIDNHLSQKLDRRIRLFKILDHDEFNSEMQSEINNFTIDEINKILDLDFDIYPNNQFYIRCKFKRLILDDSYHQFYSLFNFYITKQDDPIELEMQNKALSFLDVIFRKTIDINQIVPNTLTDFIDDDTSHLIRWLSFCGLTLSDKIFPFEYCNKTFFMDHATYSILYAFHQLTGKEKRFSLADFYEKSNDISELSRTFLDTHLPAFMEAAPYKKSALGHDMLRLGNPYRFRKNTLSMKHFISEDFDTIHSPSFNAEKH